MQVRQGTVPIDGAELYYETRGESGEPVLIIQGALGETTGTAQLADVLAEHYQVISYDRRGLSRSTVPADEPPVTLSRHADDVRALLDEVASQPVRVVGASIGALIGLELAVRHPDQVATLVAHEPPMPNVVVDVDREAALDQVADLARTDVRAAIKYMASLEGERATPEPGARPEPLVGDLDTNLRRFFEHDFPAVRQFAFDARQLANAQATTQIILTGGIASRGHWEYRCAQQLARDLGCRFVELPGGHNGLPDHPTAIAAELRNLFEGGQSP